MAKAETNKSTTANLQFIKDRMALKMIEDAEKDGRLKNGMEQSLEGTGGNTGIDLTIAAIIKIGMCFTATDKRSEGRVDAVHCILNSQRL